MSMLQDLWPLPEPDLEPDLEWLWEQETYKLNPVRCYPEYKDNEMPQALRRGEG